MSLLKRFAKDERGVLAIELCIMTPILVWVLISTWVYFDLFRTEGNVARASITVADMLSREVEPVTDAYIDTALTLLEELTFSDDSPRLRVTAYTYDGTVFQVLWSEARGYPSALTNLDLDSLRSQSRMPILGEQRRAVLVETSTQHVPLISTKLSLFNMPYIDDHVFNTFTVVNPRFGNKKLCFDDDPDDLSNVPIC